MTSNKPYLLRALNEWILDNQQTPHVIVDINAEGVDVPEQAIQDGKLVLNIAPQAIRNLHIGNESITFQARFTRSAYEIFLPIDAVMAIYARENGQGMMFAQGKETVVDGESDGNGTGSDQPSKKPPSGSHLKLIR